MDRPPRRSLKTGETAPLLIYEADRYPQVVRWTLASETTGGKDEVPSQGTAPISPLFSRAQFLVCFGAGQQDSSGYSLAKEGTPRHQVNGPVPLEARPGWFVPLPIIGGLNQPPHLRPLRRLRGIFLMGAATPPCPRRGLRLSLQLSSMPPCPAKRCGTWQGITARRGGRAIQKISRSIRLSRGRGGLHPSLRWCKEGNN